jgi:hypothetical protein
MPLISAPLHYNCKLLLQKLSLAWGCLAIWCWRGFEGIVDLSLVLTASGFGYPENQSFGQTPHNVTAPV